ncbi:36386_t:CDS:1, partial [Racocetra persica]
FVDLVDFDFVDLVNFDFVSLALLIRYYLLLHAEQNENLKFS